MVWAAGSSDGILGVLGDVGETGEATPGVSTDLGSNLVKSEQRNIGKIQSVAIGVGEVG